MEAWGAYYAERISVEYALSYPASEEDLLEICAARGVAVRKVHRLGEWGLYFRLPEPLILLDEAAPPYVLAHELLHHLVQDLAEWDDEEHVVYAFSRRARTQQERDAHHFALLLCGPW